MSELPLVSVFMPTYNHEKFVGEAIESVLSQEYPTMEIVIGDDGSTDGTQEILKKYKMRYPEAIKLILSEKNTGITANCNRILKECTGDYVALFSGDDLWLPGKIAKQVRILRNYPDAVLCFTRTEVFDSDSGTAIRVVPRTPIDPIDQVNIVHFSRLLVSAGRSFLITSSAIPHHGFREWLPQVSDWLFYIEIMRNGRVVYVDEVLAKYRRHRNNYSNNIHNIFAECLMTFEIIKKEFPDMQEMVEEERLNMMNKHLLHYTLQTDEDRFLYSFAKIATIAQHMKFTMFFFYSRLKKFMRFLRTVARRTR